MIALPGMGWHTVLVLSAILAFASASSCSFKTDSPEERIRELLSQAEDAAKDKDLGVFRQLISNKYADNAGRDKAALVGLLGYHFLGNRSIHLFTRVDEIVFPGPGKAVVTLFVAMAGRPIASQKELIGLRADLHRFVITLAEEGKGDWKALRGEWRRAGPKDFI
jgi:hypothetical protein